MLTAFERRQILWYFLYLCWDRPDRLARSLKDLLEIVEAIRERGAGFRSLAEDIDTTTSTGRLVFHVFASIAQFERAKISERTREGLASARKRGRTGGIICWNYLYLARQLDKAPNEETREKPAPCNCLSCAVSLGSYQHAWGVRLRRRETQRCRGNSSPEISHLQLGSKREVVIGQFFCKTETYSKCYGGFRTFVLTNPMMGGFSIWSREPNKNVTFMQ